jgi:hypothetical protein
VARCQRDELIATAIEKWIVGYEEGAHAALDKSCKHSVDVGGRASVHDMYLLAHCACRLLYLTSLEICFRIVRVH